VNNEYSFSGVCTWVLIGGDSLRNRKLTCANNTNGQLYIYIFKLQKKTTW
jgi:hypothetical protein